ncbi:YkgJ family cysteine cluster protein [Neorhizobium sp. JUb45]|uniref:YkgJ family cysteine cluster protein n=1 Tax=unclassified Neorhizobium TaxID=2629175 RepID=UPI00104E2B70|nr:YkgJ family cysteine cluster protein [Neorhizobium sp. JUb45]TCR02807.1 hypothetical protein EDF70_103232 [Neorhizobium sp. JUb45]
MAVSSGRPDHDRHDAGNDGLVEDDEGGESLFDCQACGACCSYSEEWPRFTTESDEALDLIPLQFVAADQRGMRCEDSRCSALTGRVGVSTSCGVYDVRPDVCRECSPGDYACKTARAAFGIK